MKEFDDEELLFDTEEEEDTDTDLDEFEDLGDFGDLDDFGDGDFDGIEDFDDIEDGFLSDNDDEFEYEDEEFERLVKENNDNIEDVGDEDIF